MAKKKMNKTRSLALCGILSALSVVTLYLSSVFSVLDLTLAGITLFIMLFAILEIGGKYPLIMYAVVSVISLIILPQKFTAFVYAFFFGWYPSAKIFFERFKPFVSWILKILCFNASYALLLVACTHILGLNYTGALQTNIYYIVMFILGNVAFIMIDIMLKLVIIVYRLKLRKQLGIDKLLK